MISRLHCPLVNGHRVSLKLTDGATVTYDLYHAIEDHPNNNQGDFTLCVCPGIGNNSESVYIRYCESFYIKLPVYVFVCLLVRDILLCVYDLLLATIVRVFSVYIRCGFWQF